MVLPDKIKAMQSAEPVARAIRDEQLTFQTHRETFASQLAGLTEAQALAHQHVEILDKKNDATKRQVALFQNQLDAISPLVSRGTVAVPQRLALEQNLMQLETAQFDIELAILKAPQEENTLKRANADLKRQHRSEAMTDLNQTRTQLTEIAQQIALAKEPQVTSGATVVTGAEHIVARASWDY
jgi:hypothetical protein